MVLKGASTWVEATVTMLLALIWVTSFIVFAPFTPTETLLFVFSPIAIPLLIVTFRKKFAR
jgi:hypothetical protein